MSVESLLVAYDGSPSARRALAHAAELVGRGGHVSVVNVIPVQSVSARLETVSDGQRARQHRLLQEACDFLAGRDVECQAVEAAGDPLVEILAAAERAAAEILVVGRGRKRRHRLGGSLGIRLARRSERDILVVN